MASNSRFGSLIRRSDFLELKATGRVVHVDSWLLVNWRFSKQHKIRCGWTIPSHIGNAVIRNRMKRWGREFWRNWIRARELHSGVDVNFVFKRRPNDFYKTLTHEKFDIAMEKFARGLA